MNHGTRNRWVLRIPGFLALALTASLAAGAGAEDWSGSCVPRVSSLIPVVFKAVRRMTESITRLNNIGAMQHPWRTWTVSKGDESIPSSRTAAVVR